MQYFDLRFTFSLVSRQKLASFCRETAVRRRSNPSLTVGAPMASLTVRDFASEPRPLGSGLSHRDRVSRQKLASLASADGCRELYSRVLSSLLLTHGARLRRGAGFKPTVAGW